MPKRAIVKGGVVVVVIRAVVFRRMLTFADPENVPGLIQVQSRKGRVITHKQACCVFLLPGHCVVSR